MYGCHENHYQDYLTHFWGPTCFKIMFIFLTITKLQN